MLNVLLGLWIVAVGSDVPLPERYPEAIEVFHCAFDESWDENFDDWPDGWTRRRGRGFPDYVSVKTSEEPSPVGNRCLRVDLDGGAAAAYSPPIAIGPLFSYVLEGYLKTEGLNNDRAYFSITLLDAKRHRLQTFQSEKVGQTGTWRKLRLGPISPEADNTRFAVVGLHVEPQSRQDIRGTVLFDDVWLGRFPRLDLRTSDPYNFFTEADRVEVHCRASGFLRDGAEVTFQLEDVLGGELARQPCRLQTRAASSTAELSLDSFSDDPVGLIGHAAWKPPLPGPGFYRVRVTLKGRSALVQQRELNLVLIEPRRSAPGGPFGWTLPGGDKPLPLPALSRLVTQAGLSWIKYPFWYDPQADDEVVDGLIAFSQQLSGRGIELVGLLHEPPLPLRSGHDKPGSPEAADVFAPEPDVWYPLLEPMLTRLAIRVRWWQLGDDSDTSFAADAELAEKIGRIKAALDRIGQDVNLGFGWPWMSGVPTSGDDRPPWRFLTLSADPPLTCEDLAAHLDATADAKFQRWVVMEPLPADSHSAETRVADLVQRMVTAKVHGAEAVFCPQPFSTDCGLLGDDGTPGELFLPWRTTALELGSAEYLGSLQLPGGSSNHVFAHSDDVVLVVFNDRPTEEVIYLGENVRQIDVWGRSVTPAGQGHRQVIRVGRLPTFVTGVDESITRCRLGFRFSSPQIPSIFGRPHSNSFHMESHFAGKIAGRVTLVTPDVWMVEPKETAFRLAVGQSWESPFRVVLPYNANSGSHQVRADFELQGEPARRFSVYRRIHVGLDDVSIQIATRLNDRGELEVEQRLANKTDAPVSFRCQLYVPGRRREAIQVVDQDRGQDVRVYILPDGNDLLGKTLWLRAEETDGPRILSYRFVAKP